MNRLRQAVFALAALFAAAAAHAQCTNCTTTTVGGDAVHTWNASGTFTPPAGVTSVQVLVVGGGGGGGFPIDRTGGGGGAGGLISNAAFAVAGTITVTVGAGGTGGTSAAGATAGGNSVFGSLTAVGGGRGGTGPGANGVYATAGGSGGGGYHNPSDSGKAGTAGQGNAGGTGYDSTITTVGFKAGGGGGAGGAGTTATPTVNGTGGAGLQNSISGAALFYAGGGGGGIQVYTGTILGGSGVGGNGGANGTAGTAGTANRGGGGGGGSQNIGTSATGAGGAGGSGVVIVRYTPPPPTYYSRVATGNWSANATWSNAGCNGAAATSIPGATNDVVICNGHTVTVNTAAQALSVELQTGNAAVNLNHSGTNSLTIGSGGVTLDSTTNNVTKTWNIGAGSATVNGPVTMNSTGGTNNNRVVRIDLSTGTLDINGDLTMNAVSNVRAVIAATGTANIFLSGNFTFNNGTLTPGPSSTFTYDGPGGFSLAHSGTIQYRNLVVNKPGGTSTQAGSTLTVLGNLDIQAGTVNMGTASVAVGGTTAVSGTLGFTSATGTATFTGAVTVNGGGTWNNSANEDVAMGNSLTNDGTFNSGTGTYTFQTTAGAVWAGSSGLDFAGPVTVSANRTNNTTTSVAGNLTGGATLTNSGGQTLRIGGTSTITGLTATAVNNTVEYNGTGAQTVKTTNYHHLAVDKSANTATTTTGTVNVEGNLTVSNGTLNLAGTTVTVTGTTDVTGTLGITNATGAKTFNGNVIVNNGGTWNHTVNSAVALNGNLTNNGTFTANGGAAAVYTFGGGGAQTITGTNGGTTVIPRVTLNNASGLSLTGNHDLQVGTQLTLTSGRITTNANVLFVSYTTGNGAIAGAGASDFVVGNLRKAYTAGATQTRTFEVGTVAGGVRYAPVGVTLVVPAGGAGNFTVSSTAGDHPDIGSSTLEGSLSINRFWTLTRDSVGITTNANNSITFNYVAADHDAGTTASQFLVGRYVAPDWTEITPPGTPTATATTISGTGITQAGIAGAYQVAQRRVLVATRLHVVLPGQTFVAGTGVTGTPTDRTAGVAFNLVSLVATDASNFIATGYAGPKTIAYSGPGTGGSVAPSYTTAVSFTNGVSTTALATTLTLAEATTLTATDGTLTGIQSALFNVVAGAASRLHVVLPGQSFVPGSGAAGAASDQVIGVAFPLTSLVVTDQFYNMANYNSSPTVTWTLAPPAAGSTFTNPVSFSAGVSSTPLTTTVAAAGTYTLTAGAAGLTGVPSGSFSLRESFACSGWLYHKLITINQGQVGAGGVTDFPVLVRIPANADLRDKALPTGTDILFTDLTSTVKYDHEIESYNGATGELIAWVKLPSVSSSANTQFYMYYGNASAAPQQSPAGVWSNGYRMVHHLEETGGLGTSLLDSTSNANNGTAAGTGATFPAFIDATGFIDGARSHPGVTAATPPALNFPSSGTLTITGAQTAEAWAYVESGQPAPDHNPIFWKGVTIGYGTAYQFRIAVGPAGAMTWGVTCGTSEGWFEAGVPVLNNWAHYALTWDGTTARAYINGVLQTISNNSTGATLCGGQALNTNAEPVRSGFALRGEIAGQQTFLRGRTDELRVSAAARSVAWLLTQYNNQSSPPTFHTVGPELGQACLNHIRIEHDGIGLTCAPESVTVRACTDAACSGTYLGNVTTTLSPAGWVGGNTINFTGGFAFAELRRTTPGFVTLGATATFPTTTATTRCFNGGVETCSMEFKTSGFIFDVPNLASCKPSGSVTITAVRADQTSQACVPAFESGTRSVNFWSVYEDPATGGSQVQVNGTPVATASPGTGINLAFAAGATSTFTVRYPDAGQVRLRAQFTGTGDESGLVMAGEDIFVAAPVGLAVVPSGGACVPGDATCAAYRKAGETFTHHVRAACWTSDADTDLSDNPVTPNFRMTGIPLSAGLVAPSGGANATLGAATVNFGSGDNGNAAVSQTVSEVGVFTISATPGTGAYFGLTIPGGTTPNIGRFTPDHFDVSPNTPEFAAACGAFTYVGQAFAYGTVPVLTVTAKNLSGGTTQNYRSSFFRITGGSLTGKAYAAETGTLDTATLTAPDPAIVDNDNGTATLTFNSGTGIAFTRTAPVAPFSAEISLAINVADTDAIAYASNPARFGQPTAGNGIAFSAGKVQRFGRLRLQNAYGSGTVALPVPIETQYWNGTAFARNEIDSCTALAATDIGLSDYTANLNAPETVVAVPPPTISFALGLGALTMTPPGANNAGSVLLTPNLAGAGLGYLGAWTGSTWNPAARAAFGLYGSQPKNFIFFRENY